MIRVEKYGRFWSVWIDADLVCVTVYKRGALRVKELLSVVS